MSEISQRITSITRMRFMQIWQEVQNGTLAMRWPKGKMAITKAEKVEERQLRAMLSLIQDDSAVFDKLLDREDWNEVEFVRVRGGQILVKAKRARRGGK